MPAALDAQTPSLESRGGYLQGDPLTIPGAEELLGAGLAQAAERVRRTNPAFVSARERSRTEFEHLDAGRAVRLARETFPAAVDNPAGGLPKLPSGERILKYEARNAVAIVSSSGKHGVIESLGPIATAAGHGRFTPIDLALQSTGSGYAPVNDNVAVRIANYAGNGVSMPGTGVSLTPVNASGRPLGGSEGIKEGASVVYANTQADTDTLAKPTTSGFEIDSLLRSVDSPETLYFKVGMPAGAKLVDNRGAAGARVLLDGRTIAGITPPGAEDAAGTGVPVRMSVAGDTLVVVVMRGSSEYQYPIAVDPQAYDEKYALPGPSESETETNITDDTETDWRYHEYPSKKFETPYAASEGFDYDSQGNITPGEHAEFRYGAHGQASVGFIEETSSTGVSAASGVVTKLEFASHQNSKEAELTLAGAGQQYTNVKQSFGDRWNEGEKHYEGQNDENLVRFIQTSTNLSELPAEDFFWFQLNYGAWVGVNQKQGPSVSFNTTDQTVAEAGGRQNVLYGSGGWLGEHNGAVAIKATDPGLGVSYVKIKDLTAGPHGEHWTFVDPVYSDHLCTGVWCNPIYKTSPKGEGTEITYEGTEFTYNKEMAEGPNTFELCAEDEAMMSSCTTAIVNVDNINPSEIKFSGFATEGAEISASQHQITVEVTDGTAPTPSSGIRSIQVFVDGTEIGKPAGSCSPGVCTATGTWTINGENLGTGEHNLRMVVTDNADNGLEKEITFAVRNATPTKIGPGTVDPVTGQFALGASDVDVAGAGSVSRSYESRTQAGGAESPLGPQWKLSAGSGVRLKIAPNGNAEITSSSGALTTFIKKESKFIAPKGDENLTLEAVENETGKGITEYLLKHPTAGTTTRFLQPVGTWQWAPSAIEGPAPSNTVRYGYQVGEQIREYSAAAVGLSGITRGPDGNVWFTQQNAATVDKVTSEGAITEYKLQSPFVCPNYIVTGPEKGTEQGLWFTDDCDHQIGRVTQSGITTAYNFAAGVSLQGIVSGPDGNLWFAMNGTSKIGRMTTSGQVTEFALPAGSKPQDIVVGPDGNLWFTDNGTSKIGKITTAGAITEYALPSGSKPYDITLGSDGKLWFTDNGTSKIGKITTAGTVTEYALPSESLPRGVGSGPGGTVFFADYGTNKIGRITIDGSVSEIGIPTGSDPEHIVEGIDGNIWYTDAGSTKLGKITPIVEPTEVLGPVPTGVSCGKNPTEVKLEELKPGCRALTFSYPETTTATGEGATEWGAFKNHVSTVSFTGTNQSGKTETVAMAQYSYDAQGRLRAEWDPRISPALKTTYGYDPEGHVTALSPPNQQPWLMHYAASVPGDGNTGRLLSTTRPAASTALGNGLSPVNTAIPTLSSTSPVIGTTLSVSGNGAWSNSALAYNYQWEDCNSSGAECAAIVGAVNQSYTPQASDGGYALVVQVAGLNATGASSASTAASKTVPLSVPVYSESFGSSGSESEKLTTPDGVTVDSTGNVWVADYGANRVEKFSASGAFVGTYAPDSMWEPVGIAANPTTGNIYVANRGRDRIDELSPSGVLIKSFGGEGAGPGQLNAPDQVAIDEAGNVWVVEVNNHRVDEFSAGGNYLTSFGTEGAGHGQFMGATGVTVCGGNIYVVDQLTNRVEEFTPDSKWVSQFGSEGTAEGQFSKPSEIACEPAGRDLYVSDKGNNRIEEFNSAGTFLNAFGGSGEAKLTTPIGVAVGPSGVLYVGDNGNKRIEKWTPTYSTNNPAPAPPSPGTSAVSTVEYRVPVTGAGAPHEMKSELYKWGQKSDVPVEATALFPPDEPQGWPAASYKRATLLYMDADARTTNTASPSGAISTVEYNSLNEVTRSLTASDRAIAMKESCESEISCKSAEVAKHLSSENIYSTDGTELLETFGPEHPIKLANGKEEETRDRKEFKYNEGEPSGGEVHKLMTKWAGWTENGAKQKLELHETVNYYSNKLQGELGWTLRKPLETKETVEGKTTTHLSAYWAQTGALRESFTTTTSAAPVFSMQFGALGTGEGQFKEVSDVALSPDGYVWSVDRGNNRIVKSTAGGSFVAAYGAAGTGGGSYKEPFGVAINQKTGNAYITDSGNNRVEMLNSSGAFVATIGWGVSDGKAELEICKTSCLAGISGGGNGQFSSPLGIAVDASGNVWVANDGTSSVEELSESGAFIRKFGSQGNAYGQLHYPVGIAISEGDIYVADSFNNRVDVFSPSGGYLNQFGSSGTGNGQFNYPLGIASDPVSGDLFVTDTGNGGQEFTPSGTFVARLATNGAGTEQLSKADGLTVRIDGAIFVADSGNNRVQVWQPIPAGPPLYTGTAGSKGSGAGQFEGLAYDAVAPDGSVWTTDYAAHRIDKFSSSGTFLMGVGWGVKDGKAEAETCTGPCQIGLSGTGNGQFEGPWGIAIDQTSSNIYVADYTAGRIEEFSSSGAFIASFGSEGTGGGQFKTPEGVAVDAGGNVWVADTGNNRVEEFSSTGSFLLTMGWGVRDGKAEAETCTSGCQAAAYGAGAGEMDTPAGVAVSDGNIYVGDYVNNRVDEFSASGAYVSEFGSKGTGNGQFEGPAGVGTDPSNGDLYVVDHNNARVQEFTAAGRFLTVFGTAGTGAGQLKLPKAVAVSTSGQLYVTDAGNSRVQEWVRAPRPGNEGAKDTKTIYYTAEANAEYPSCGNRPEWANLVCQTEPVVQPGDSGPPPLPVTTTTYNIWDEPETVTEKIGSVTRTSKKTYDSAGRLTGSEETSTSSENATLPVVTDEYSAETGAMVKESETLEGKAKTITSAYDTLGRLVSYTDAEGSVTKYAYDIDGRVEELSEPMGRQVYSYDATTGFMTKLLDTAAGTFTATYGVAGEMLTEGYPNGLVAKYTYTTIGQASKLEYEKTTHCTEKCVWFSDAESFGVNGELASQASTLSSEAYSYNEEGQLTQTQETPVGGKGCVTRAYGYDEEGERTSLTTRVPNEKGECTSEGGLVEGHAYDVVGRLLDPGITYDALGNMTKVPALDAGGQALASTFYVDNQVATQEQAGKSIAYTYDPAGRALLTKQAKTLKISHYAGPGEALTWTCEEEEGKKECEEQKAAKWTRSIPGIDGALDAIQTNGETPALQLHDLEGNIVATVSDIEAATGLEKTFISTEFGVPSGGKAPKYGWLGARGAESELETGVITQAGSTYVPQLARTAQTEGIVPPGAAPNGIMATEAYSPPELPWANQSGNEAATNTVAEQRAMEQEALGGPDPKSEAWLTLGGAEELLSIMKNAQGAASTLDELWKFLRKEFITGPVINWILKKIGLHDLDEWTEAVETGLEGCIEDYEGMIFFGLATSSSYRCRVGLPEKWVGSKTVYALGIPIFPPIGVWLPDFENLPEVAMCLSYKEYCYRITGSDGSYIYWS